MAPAANLLIATAAATAAVVVATLAYRKYTSRASAPVTAASSAPSLQPKEPKKPVKAAAADSSDSDSDDDDNAGMDHEIWKRIEDVLRDFALSRLGMAAAKKWVRMMGDPKNKELDRLRGWLLNKVNGRNRVTPQSQWQSGCPEIFANLRAKPVWNSDDAPFIKPFEE